MNPKVTISLNPPYNGEFYSSNDQMSGVVNLQITKALSIRKIVVILKGLSETVTKIDQEYMFQQNGMMMPGQDNKSFHTLMKLEQRVFPPDNVWNALEGSSKPFKVKPGTYDHKFQFGKFPRKPECLKNHTSKTVAFVTRSNARLPPTFNSYWQQFNKIDNLDLYFYSFGKVIYMVQVQIELGKSSSWFKPFHKLIREIETFEFIPEPKDLIIEPDEDEDEEFGGSSNNWGHKDITMNNEFFNHSNFQIPSKDIKVVNGVGYVKNDRNFSQANSIMIEDGDIRTRPASSRASTRQSSRMANGMRVFSSAYKIGLPDGESNMRVEVRSRDLKQIYRKDYLFRSGSQNFDKIFAVIEGNVSSVSKMQIVARKIQLNLLESATYLSQGIANGNYSSLKLIELDLNQSKSSKPLLNLNDLRENVDGSEFECELRLKDHPILRKLLFNEEDYKHRGNRLYSFKTCTIKRIFSFQLLIDWEINGIRKQSEVNIYPVQIFCQVREHTEAEILPRYVPPPTYSEMAT
ncbi:YLR392C [Saccharomyces arboricola H-6]|uniref:Arrestin-related trafficking adapter 10 n=1 Tax=Saccharomyces arboricola (strain H-6 / AS 2.3317 / CBS 10644) TaxID=1160507 RepID=J8Q4W5_SACAR|nr:YLR392C [Saccharomyces arboricola H-6]